MGFFSSNRVASHCPPLVWTHCIICSMYMYYCKTLQETTTPVALGKSLVGEKIITIKCRTLESSTKAKENEAAKTKFSEMWWLIFFSALTTKDMLEGDSFWLFFFLLLPFAASERTNRKLCQEEKLKC